LENDQIDFFIQDAPAVWRVTGGFGPNRKAWSVSSIHAMLRNRRYFGEHSWDVRQYRKA
jgi:Recombinase